MTITTFDRQNLPQVRADIDAALKAVCDKHGISLRLGNITYDPSGASFRAALEGKAGDFESIAIQKAVEMARLYPGVDASHPSNHPARKGATLLRYEPKKRARPWVFRWNGKDYVTNDDGMKMMWPRLIRSGAEEVDDLIER
jgi:hypothetical protein